MKININPPGSEAKHLAALNRSFGDWGDARRLQWCFARASSPLAADVIFAELNGAILAGVGISYRRLMTPAGRSMLAGILTPFFTSPLRERAEQFANLVAYVDRMMLQHYPDFAWTPLQQAA